MSRFKQLPIDRLTQGVKDGKEAALGVVGKELVCHHPQHGFGILSFLFPSLESQLQNFHGKLVLRAMQMYVDMGSEFPDAMRLGHLTVDMGGDSILYAGAALAAIKSSKKKYFGRSSRLSPAVMLSDSAARSYDPYEFMVRTATWAYNKVGFDTPSAARQGHLLVDAMAKYSCWIGAYAVWDRLL